MRSRRDAIFERFKAEVIRLRLAPRPLPEPLLIDHLDDLLDELCVAFDDDGSCSPEEPARKHAEIRWEARFDIGSLVREYGALAVAIVEVLAQSGVTLSPAEQVRLTSTLNHAAAISAQEYAKFRDEEYAAQYRMLEAAEAVRDGLIMEAPLGVAFLDRDLRFRMVNEQLARLNGITAADHVGRTPAEILHDVPAAFLMARGREILSTGRALPVLEITGETPAAPGVKRAWAEHWYPVRRRGELLGVGVIVEEVTDRKRAEAFRERLLGVVSHDLRNPLNSIMMSANLVLVQPDVSEPVASFTRKVLTSARRMLGIIEQLYDYVSVDQGGGLPLHKARIDLAAVARRVIDESMLAFVGRPAVELTIDGDLFGEWDEGRIGQVLSNLIANALQHGTGATTVALSGVDGSVHVEVRNRGKPIPPETLANIFEPFKGSSSKQHLGLGLFISREIVRAHGGEIHATSSESRGTVFSIDLPRST